MTEIKVLKDILSANDQIADKNRQLLASQKVFAINIMSTPGAGKTSLILEMIKRFKDKVRVGVIEGDIASSVDAETVGRTGVPVVQINTGGQCHLDASMVNTALNNLSLSKLDLLIIENVGNLVCPAEFNIGESLKVLVSSTPEGDDKPFKYPLMFETVDVVLVNKIDLLPYLKFNLESFKKTVKSINGKVEIFPISCTSGEGVDRWVSWLLKQMS